MNSYFLCLSLELCSLHLYLSLSVVVLLFAENLLFAQVQQQHNHHHQRKSHTNRLVLRARAASRARETGFSSAVVGLASHCSVWSSIGDSEFPYTERVGIVVARTPEEDKGFRVQGIEE
jgi:hypothetical protein